MNDVRLTIERVDLSDVGGGNEVLLDLTETGGTVLDRAVAWAEVRGYTRLTPALKHVLRTPPAGGWCAVINVPHSLAILATWPWCPGPHDLLALYEMSSHR